MASDACAALRTWAALMGKRKEELGDTEFERARRVIEQAVSKSCLLDRMVHCGEQPSQTPCPVHKGRWSGMHLGWPETFWSDGTPVKECAMLRRWYDEGCRCFKHKCNCTTGWQPDQHCGCDPPPPER